mmetsp:Transcript_23949/g.71264  ORF Transcript_23949/g.71264 Transcript_23949/m.71264 type:complete len:210 (-) Transcript_23949:369-998(-)
MRCHPPPATGAERAPAAAAARLGPPSSAALVVSEPPRALVAIELPPRALVVIEPPPPAGGGSSTLSDCHEASLRFLWRPRCRPSRPCACWWMMDEWTWSRARLTTSTAVVATCFSMRSRRRASSMYAFSASRRSLALCRFAAACCRFASTDRIRASQPARRLLKPQPVAHGTSALHFCACRSKDARIRSAVSMMTSASSTVFCELSKAA